MKRLSICLIFFLLLVSCISDFTPEVEGAKDILVVDGMITAGESTIRLSRSVSITEDLHEENVITSAVVSVERSDGVSFEARQSEKGVYKIQTGDLVPNLEYRLNLTIDNKQYQSSFLKPLFSSEIDSVNFQKKGIRDPVTIHISSHAGKNESPYYRWSYIENWEVKAPLYGDAGYIDGKFMHFNPYTPNNTYYCWAKDSSKVLLLGTTEKLAENRVVEQKLFEISSADERLSVLYHVEVSQVQIREEAYDYFKMLQEEIERTGGIFSSVMSAGDNGNIFCLSDPTEIIIGFVEVSTVTQMGMYISSDMDLYMPQDVVLCEGYRKGEGIGKDESMLWYRYDELVAYPRCVDCRRGKATKDRPEWWPNNHY